MGNQYGGLAPNMSYWLAIDEQLDSHKFRVIKYSSISETYYTCEYGTVSRRRNRNTIEVSIKPKGQKWITVVYPEDQPPSEQETLSLLVFWTAKSLFLAVPAPTENLEQGNQETLF